MFKKFVLTLFIATTVCGLAVPQLSVADSAAPTFVYPIMAARLTSKFGMRKHPIRRYRKHHSGIDLAAPKNSHVRSVAAGRVVFAGDYKGYGKLVTIEHDAGHTSLYGHLHTIHVTLGQQVSAGELIGRVGSTGLATGPHLHFEWRKNGKLQDPLKAFPGMMQDPSG